MLFCSLLSCLIKLYGFGFPTISLNLIFEMKNVKKSKVNYHPLLENYYQPFTYINALIHISY